MTDLTTGRYRYLLGGDEQPVDERFRITAFDDHTKVESWRNAHGTSLQVQALYFEAGHCECELIWNSTVPETPEHVETHYAVAVDGSVQVSWRINRGAQQHHSVEADSRGGPSFFPLMRVFSGRTVRKLALTAGQPMTVVVPDIRDPRVVDSFLTPLVSDRHAASVQPGTVEVDGVDHECLVVDYRGGQYDADATVFVDDGGLLLRYTWPQAGVGDWDVQLCEVQGPWPAPAQW
ncbi:MAG TPA: hypothetical protein DCM51_00800 [Actinobacteria bacterium]|nr:hypothetical protein [Actinomycetota bacterium]